MERRNRILVLGGTGFIGTWVLDELIRQPNRFNVALLAHHQVPFKRLEACNLFIGSLPSFDLGIIDQVRPDCIIHMARIGGKGKLGRRLSAKKGHQANQRLINYLSENHPKTKIIYVSGTLVYGNCGEALVTEDTPHHPVAFARAYAHAEAPWRQAQKGQKLDISMLMPPWIIGPKSWFKTFYIRQLYEQAHVPIYGNGENWMSVLDVEDCAGLIVRAITHAQPFKDYNLFAPGFTIKMQAFARIVAEITGLPVKEYSVKEVKKQFGHAVYEAFNFSLKSGTLNDHLISAYDFRHNDLRRVVKLNMERGGWKDGV